MAIVDANHEFRYVNVGAQGRISDGGVFVQCNFFKSMERNELAIPKASTIRDTDIIAPYMLVADDAFQLTDSIMKPFSRRSMEDHEGISTTDFLELDALYRMHLGFLLLSFVSSSPP